MTDMCGDFLLVFSGEHPSLARQRGSDWIAEARTDSWTLWRQDVGLGWKGFPISTFSDPGWRLWLLGEVFGLPSERSLEPEVLAVADGRKSAGSLNGHFLLFGWNAAARMARRGRIVSELFTRTWRLTVPVPRSARSFRPWRPRLGTGWIGWG